MYSSKSYKKWNVEVINLQLFVILNNLEMIWHIIKLRCVSI